MDGYRKEKITQTISSDPASELIYIPGTRKYRTAAMAESNKLPLY